MRRRSAFGVQRSAFGVQRLAFGVWRSGFSVRGSAFGVRRRRVAVSNSQPLITLNFCVIFSTVMDDFTQFDAFERCREFARGVGKHLSRGAFSKDPVLTTAAEDIVICLFQFWRGI